MRHTVLPMSHTGTIWGMGPGGSVNYQQGVPGCQGPQGIGRQPEPSGVTGVLAAVISLGAGALCVMGAISAGSFVYTDVESEYRTPEMVSMPLYIGLAGLLGLLGGVLLLRRTTIGRAMVIVLAAVGLFFAGWQVVYVTDIGLDSTVFALAEAAVPLAVLILAALPSTGRWIATKGRPRTAAPVFYAPPSYGPPRH